MAVERHWRQAPGWFAALPTDQQAAVAADYRLSVAEQTAARKPRR